MASAMTPKEKTQHLEEILGAFGSNKISREQFNRYCRQYEITEKDIDNWCDENCVWCPDQAATASKVC
jgi:hypothetical protein